MPGFDNSASPCGRVAPMDASEAAIRFTAVQAVRGGVDVLRGLDLAIAPGETIALVGRSGAGKSTILKLINRLLEPSSGEVLVEGREHGGLGSIRAQAPCRVTCFRKSACFRT